MVCQFVRCLYPFPSLIILFSLLLSPFISYSLLYSLPISLSAHGGGWGYNAGSIEAIRMSPDQDVLLGGFGLYGGRGQYNAEIKVRSHTHVQYNTCTVP